jgi:hypothetical protein
MQVKSTNKEYQELGLSRPSPPLLFCSWVVWASRAASGGELGAHPLGANKTRIFQRAFAQMCPPRTATTFPFFYPVFPFKGTKSACKNEREKKKKNRSARTHEQKRRGGRAETGGSARGRGHGLSRPSSPRLKQRLPLFFRRPGESPAPSDAPRIGHWAWQPAVRVPASRARFPGSVLGCGFRFRLIWGGGCGIGGRLPEFGVAFCWILAGGRRPSFA